MQIVRRMAFWWPVLGALGVAPAVAQTTATLAPVTVTGSVSSQTLAPAAQYSGPELLLRAKSTLGETLDGTPGVSSTYFGPNASRPIVRGQDGDRLRIVNNGGASNDVSGLSYDHAVSVDPLTVERIEVLRGPAALQYGGSAAGTVINVVDNRIPREALFDAQGGVTGKADLGLATGNREQSGAVLLETGNQQYALHADAMSRNTRDVAVPISLVCTRGGVNTAQRSICNSASEAYGGALGGSLFFDRGYLGASVSNYGSRYGTVAEDTVSIDMHSSRMAIEGELRDLSGPVQSLKAQFSRSDYQHVELNAGTPGTVFKSEGQDLRLQARHTPWGRLSGVVGVQLEDNRFSADGQEAFAPYSHTEQSALFAHESLGLSWGQLNFGARLGSVQVASLGNPQLPRFVPAARHFMPSNYALGVVWPVAPRWQVNANVSLSERAPKDYELFAKGVHVATHTYEIGSDKLDVERATSLDIGLSWKQGADTASVQAFVNQFSNFIALQARNLAAPVPEYNYTQVQARFVGLEANGRKRLMDAGAQTIDLDWRWDRVQADDQSTGQPLPRIAPMRTGATLLWSRSALSARVGVDQWAAQDRVPPGRWAVDGYTLWHAAVTLRDRVGKNQLLWYARLDNASDALAYSASSILTQTAPGKSPLPGRSLKLGLQLSF